MVRSSAVCAAGIFRLRILPKHAAAPRLRVDGHERLVRIALMIP